MWAAIFGLEGVSTIQGYSFEAMLAYQAWVMVVGFLGLGYNGMNLAEDIRLGRISAYLIYPFGFWQFHASSFLAFEAIQLIVAAVTILSLGLAGWVSLSGPALLHGLLFSLCVGLFWFQVCFLLGVLSFWLEETWVLRVMMVLVSQFLSGAMLPLEIFPPWLTQILAWLPFPYMTYVPVKILMGEYTGNLAAAYATIGLWIVIGTLASQWVWRKGLRAYTGAGI
ncbi:MAG: hypothetical protein CVV27_13375 [Candidatus Melainabacteria bacterium HGW-Melainabacteria-1]|nr:MAG: hypothetical protein CVV27_13375 [Candidatus Melainabacteria bacterium HGW-Melainabacteria-1]